ncbi:MAG: CSLREA domain-containing protein [Chloroflexota bacterium]|nr:CSLREA domain-containing protein [Chloroflexota bacterium]
MKRNTWRYPLAAGLFAAAIELVVAGARESSVSQPEAFGGADVNVITGTETFPHLSQDDGALWGHGNTVVVVYNDSSSLNVSPAGICGVSVSTDGGASFTRLPERFNQTGTCSGDPSVFYSVRAAKWFASYLSSGCGAQGMARSSSPDGINWTSSGCAINSNGLIPPLTWIDNNPGSPFYGRQYAFFNNTDVAGGVPQTSYSTDDGLTWSAPNTLFFAFRRVERIAGSLGTDGTIFAQAIEEGGGSGGGGDFNVPRQNFIYRSTDGGATWSAAIAQGPTFLVPGRVQCPSTLYYGCIYTSPGGGYWKDSGEGQTGVGPNGVVHQVYSARTATPVDPGNIYYVRSTDNGLTWSAPVQLNTDTTARAQWSPSLSVNANGIVFVSWYDERNTTDDTLQRFGRASLNNGATWGPDSPLSDIVFPKPLQPDSSIQRDYVGIHTEAAFSNDNYGTDAYVTWVDGRVLIAGAPQQDVFFHKVSLAPVILTVTTTADHDDGTCNAADCTLREAINAANSATGGGVINFATGVTGTIQLASALPALARNIAVQGPGANVLTVRRNTGGAYRIFAVNLGATVSLSGLTITNGDTSGTSPSLGGGIYNDRGTVTVGNCVITGNTAANGGGIYNDGNRGTASFNVRNSTINANVSTGLGGGGIYTQGLNGGMATFSLTNCTVSGNTAASGFASSAGLENFGSGGTASVTLTNCTFNSNGIDNDRATLFLANTLLNAGTGGATLTNFNGTITSQGHNLSSDAGGGFLTGAGDLPNTAPQLSAAGLANNGGPTPTIALLSTSPARDAGNDTLAPLTDQRGYLRSGVSDIGTFEFNGTAPPALALVNAVSRKVHGSAGTFDVTLPGVECRTGGATSDHTIVFTFTNPLASVSGAAVSSGMGSVSSSAIGSDTHQYVVNLTGVANAQNVTVSLTNVTDSFGNTSASVATTIGVLLGDTNADRFVNGGDSIQIRNRAGQATDATNFRSDVNLDGFVNSGDSIVVRSRSGTALP